MSDVVTFEQQAAKSAGTAHAQALAYVWGRQDAGESARDTGYSEHFAAAYRDRRVLFDTARRGFMPNLQSAFNEWRATGKIA